jgi:hypothetical protein
VLGQYHPELLWPAGPPPEPPEDDPPEPGRVLRVTNRRAVIDIQVKLSTLLGLNQDPAILPGWGPVLADIARRVALDQQINPIWRYSVTDDHGRLLHHGHTSRRPTTTEKAFVNARDRTCRAPHCHRPAIDCDQDHRTPWAQGGPSHRGNLCVLCRRHHRMRHELGYTIDHLGGGDYKWTKTNGRHYTTHTDDLLNDDPAAHDPKSDNPDPPPEPSDPSNADTGDTTTES